MQIQGSSPSLALPCSLGRHTALGTILVWREKTEIIRLGTLAQISFHLERNRSVSALEKKCGSLTLVCAAEALIAVFVALFAVVVLLLRKDQLSVNWEKMSSVSSSSFPSSLLVPPSSWSWTLVECVVCSCAAGLVVVCRGDEDDWNTWHVIATPNGTEVLSQAQEAQ